MQRMKGQMYCTVCLAPCNLRSGHKKKMLRVSAQNKQAAANFLAAKVQISTSESGPKYIAGNGPRWRFRTRQAAATFSPPMHKYGRSPLFQDGVSSIYLQLLIFCCVRTNMAALFLTYIEKMAACINYTFVCLVQFR